MLKQRIFSALIAAPVFLFAIFIGDPFFQWVVFLLSVLAAREYRNMVFQSHDNAESLLFLGSSLFLCFNEIITHWFITTDILIFLFLAFFTFALYRIRKNLVHRDVMSLLGFSILGVIYCGYLISYFYKLRQLENGFVLVVFLLLIIWISDTSAYFVGRFFGKIPLHPQVSPKKTIEGSIGAVVGSLCIGLFYAHIQKLQYSLPFLVMLIVITNIAGQIGDLAESLIKRSFHVKDSGNILPGHGGVLDRFDSILFAAPIFYFLVR